MAVTALELINEALRTATLVGRSFNTAPKEYTSVGLKVLQQLITETSANNKMNPFYTPLEFTADIGETAYEIEGLVDIATLTFEWQQVRYPCDYKTRTEFYGGFRANNVLTLPLTYTFERTKDGATIYVYPFPDKEYIFTTWAQFEMDSDFTFTTDLLATLPKYYIDFLEYAMAGRLCVKFGRPVPPDVLRLEKYYRNLIAMQISPPDFSMQKISTLSSIPGIDYGQVNIGKGYYNGGG